MASSRSRVPSLGLLVSLLSFAIGAELEYSSLTHQYFVPTRIGFNGNNLRSSVVTMCELDWATYREDPSLVPMFHDLTKFSQCQDPKKSFDTTFGELEDEYLRRGCSLNGRFKERAPGCVPTGLVFHQSRCGSTLAANMLASLPYSLVYSESTPPVDVAFASQLSPSDQVRALRVVIAAMGRPIAAAGFNGLLPPGTAAQGWSPRHLYLKLQSSITPYLNLFRRAFPETPWLFIHRDGTEVLASLMRNAGTLPPPDAGPDVHLAHNDRGVREAPCMRHRGASSPTFVRTVLGAGPGNAGDAKVMATHPEDYCAASVAELCTTALHEAASARQEALTRLLEQRGGSAMDLPPLGDGAAVAEFVLQLQKQAGGPDAAGISVFDGMLLNATTATGTVAGIGQALFIDYRSMPDSILPAAQYHLGPRPLRVIHPFPWKTAAAGSSAATAGDAEIAAEEEEDAAVAGARPADGANATAIAAAAKQQQHQTLGPLIAPVAPDSNDPLSTGEDGNKLQWLLVRDILSSADIRAMVATSEKYSKARGRKGTKEQQEKQQQPSSSSPSSSASSPAAEAGESKEKKQEGDKQQAKTKAFPLRAPSIDKEGHFVEDAEEKQSRAWPALKNAAERYLSSIRRFLLAFNADDSNNKVTVSDPAQAQFQAADVADVRKTVEEDLKAGWLQEKDKEEALAARLRMATGEGGAGSTTTTKRRNSGFNASFADAVTHGEAAAAALDCGSSSAAGKSAPDAAATAESSSSSPLFTYPSHLPVSGKPYLPAPQARMLPIGGGYPWHYPLADILTLWNADIVTVPRHAGAFQSLRVFDFSDAQEREEALLYRRAEVPFIARNVPTMKRTIAKWSDDANIIAAMGGADAVFVAETNDDNHFMYFHRGAARLEKNYKAPTEEKRVKVGDWFRKAHEMEEVIAAEETGASSASSASSSAHLPLGWAATRPEVQKHGVSAKTDYQSFMNDHKNNGDEEAWHANGGKFLKPLRPVSPALLGVNRAAAGTCPASSTHRYHYYYSGAAEPLVPVDVDRDGGFNAPETFGFRPDLESSKKKGAAGEAGGRVAGKSRRLAAKNDAAAVAPLFPENPASVLPPQRPRREQWYMRASTDPRKRSENRWIHDFFPVYDTIALPKDGEEDLAKSGIAAQGNGDKAQMQSSYEQYEADRSFFVVDGSQQRGIHCRFGMPGIIAESHYDSGRNFIFMARGRKRYIMSSPHQCKNLQMLKTGPSARHSGVDWTTPEGIAALGNATGFEVIVEAGDALYVPAFWFHYIVSLSLNIQCNARSGTPPIGAKAISDCNFDARYSEEIGVHTDPAPPPHHAAVLSSVASTSAELFAGIVDAKVEADVLPPAIPGARMLDLLAAISQQHRMAPGFFDRPKFGEDGEIQGASTGTGTTGQDDAEAEDAAAATSRYRSRISRGGEEEEEEQGSSVGAAASALVNGAISTVKDTFAEAVFGIFDDADRIPPSPAPSVSPAPGAAAAAAEVSMSTNTAPSPSTSPSSAPPEGEEDGAYDLLRLRPIGPKGKLVGSTEFEAAVNSNKKKKTTAAVGGAMGGGALSDTGASFPLGSSDTVATPRSRTTAILKLSAMGAGLIFLLWLIRKVCCCGSCCWCCCGPPHHYRRGGFSGSHPSSGAAAVMAAHRKQQQQQAAKNSAATIVATAASGGGGISPSASSAAVAPSLASFQAGTTAFLSKLAAGGENAHSE